MCVEEVLRTRLAGAPESKVTVCTYGYWDEVTLLSIDLLRVEHAFLVLLGTDAHVLLPKSANLAVDIVARLEKRC